MTWTTNGADGKARLRNTMMEPKGTLMQPQEPERTSQDRTRILVVEDVSNVATVLKARLESYGYEVCDIANTGRKAVELAVEHEPELILMDIMLEGDMNGIEAAEIIASRLDIPIIYLSCLNDQKVFDRAIETNPYGYILKPYDSAVLRFGIENAIKKHRTDKKRKARIADLENQSSNQPSS